MYNREKLVNYYMFKTARVKEDIVIGRPMWMVSC